MTYEEFWILETALTAYVPLNLIAGPRRYLEPRWGKPWHGLQSTELIAVFDRLVESGSIVVRDRNWNIVRLSHFELKAEFDARKINRNEWIYGLTAQGGARWEKFAKADWSRFHSWEWDDDDVLEIAATTSEAAERAFRYVGPSEELRVYPETIERRTLQPWSATYWKTFEVGHAIRFKCEYFEDCEEAINCYFPGLTDAQIRQAYSCVRQDYDFFAHWYLKHPGTPPMGPI